MTTDLKKKITQLHSFIDEAFDEKKTTSYQLLLQIGVNDIQVAIHDKQQNKYIALEKYVVSNTDNFEALTDLFDILLKESKLIDHVFQSVICLIVSNLSTLVPSALFEEDKKEMYLNFNSSLAEHEVIMTDEIKSLDAKNIFAIPASLKTKLNHKYSNVKYHHASSALIDTLTANNKNQTGKKIYIHIESTHFEILLIEGKNLIFYNSFNYHSTEDFIYYVLFVFEQLQLNPEKTETILLGEVEKSSALYTLTNKYIRNIKFAERTVDSDYSYQLQTLPKHFNFTIFNSYYN
jgi:hypothetical protein